MSKTRKIVFISMVMVTAATAWFMNDWNRDIPETGHGEDVSVPTLHGVETSPFTRADADHGPGDVSPNSEVADDDADDLPSEHQSGRVKGFVCTDVGHSVSDVALVLRCTSSGEEAVFATRSDATGGFDFDRVPFGEYALNVESDSLPKGFVGPIDTPVPEGIVPSVAHILSPRASVSRTRPIADVVVTIVPGARLYGAITAGGAPVPDVHVRLEMKQYRNHFYDARTDRAGQFAFDAVQPATYTLRAWPVATDVKHELSQPLPFDIELVYGENKDLGTIELPRNIGWIRGRVVDQYGMPLADFDVQHYPDGRDLGAVSEKARTDVEGRFVFTRVPATRVKIHVGKIAALEPIGRRVLAKFAEPIPVDLSTTEGVDLDDIVVLRSEPHFLNGRIRSTRVAMRHFNVVVMSGQLARPEVENAIFGETPASGQFIAMERVPIQSDGGEEGTFTWASDHPHDDYTVAIYTTGRGDVGVRIMHVVPKPNVSEDVVIVF